MHEVRVDDVGLQRLQRASQPAREHGVDVARARKPPRRHADALVERLRVPGGVVEPDERHVVPARRERRQQREQVALGPADPAHPVDVDEPHVAGRLRARSQSATRAAAAGTASRKSHGTR